MKKNMLLFFLVVGTCQGVQAMSGARAFAHQVFGSKTAGVAAAVALGTGISSYFGHKSIEKELEALPAVTLSDEHAKEIYDLFGEAGIHNLKIVHGPGAGLFEGIANTYLSLDCFDLMKLSGDVTRRDFFDEKTEKRTEILFGRPHVLEIIKHEREHKKQHHTPQQILILNSIVPLSMLSGKAMQVAGRGKAAALAVGVAVSGMGYLGRFWHSRQCEYAADRGAADSKRAAFLHAQVLYDLSLFHSSDNGNLLKKLLRTHPCPEDRIRALEKQWGPLDFCSEQENEAVLALALKFSEIK